ncbi:tetratricopeptide repeat protein [Pyxidicoccus parkwayensis]|uniref:Tetratricopeptide repeat protein n=1 Tax=Pyxidicoccus parkwayensis TaxID=2813578 RepID=A0ABX7P820_9BACT|nr:FxSxx-COOH system tetratricopeptide repeat protein [Pyxidicoccus parkwaysis]QSQ26635.1 tetratricopeptide repeat protein [Pyxidicoccus parkwaysis]
MSASVFISYARATSSASAAALYEELTRAGIPAFLDREELSVGEHFPAALMEALLSSHLVVIFADALYFQRWYCLAELRMALAPALALPPGAPRTEVETALSSLVLALPAEGLPQQELERLPPPLRTIHWPAAGNTSALVTLVRERLELSPASLGQRLEAAGVLEELRSKFQQQSAVPPPGQLAGRILHPLDLEPSLGSAFVGRADELWRLDFMLSTVRGEASTNTAPAVAMEGGGGFGKTRLALEYVHRMGASRFPGGIIWIDADAGEARLEAQHHEVLRTFRPGVPDLRTFHEQGRNVARELAQALHALPAQAPVLFVVDNVPEPEPGRAPYPLRWYCPAIGKVSLLVTSRSRVSLGESGVQSLPVDTLAPEAAVSLLSQGLENSRVAQETWLRVADWVGNLPLALELLNRVLVLGGLTVDELVRRTEHVGPTAELDQQMDALRGQLPEGRLRGITEAFTLSYQRLTEREREAARLIAQLSPAPILFETLKALEPEGFPPAVRNALVARSFVTRLSGREKHWLGRMHRVLADFLRSQASDPLAEAMRACQGFVKLLPPGFGKEPRVWGLIDLHLPHATWVFHTLSQAEQLSDEPSFVKLGLSIGEFLLATGELQGAFEYTDWLRERALEALGTEHELTLTATTMLAQVLQAGGDASSARQLKEEVLALRRRTHGDEHPATLAALNNLAVALQGEGRWSEALALREQCLAVARRTLGPEHPQTISAMSNLASSLLIVDELARARTLAEQVLELLRRNEGDDSPEILSAKGNLAAVLERQGNTQEARVLEEQVVEGRLELFGEEHPATQRALTHLAVTLQGQGELHRSRELHEKVLEVRHRLLGPEHPDTLSTRSDLATVLHDLGNFAASRKHKEEVLETLTRTLGEDHPRSLIQMNNLAVTLCNQGDPASARSLAQRGLDLSTEKLGEGHRVSVALLGTLAMSLESMGELSEARTLREREVKSLRERLGAEHPETLMATVLLARLLSDQEHLHEASEILEQTLPAIVRAKGPEHPQTLTAMNYLAGVYRKQGHLQRAREMYERLLEVNQRVFGAEHLETHTVMHNLAGVMQQQGELPRARALYEKALRACILTLGLENPYTAMTAWDLLWLLTETHAPEPAIEEQLRNLLWVLDQDPRNLMPSLRTIQQGLLRMVDESLLD